MEVRRAVGNRYGARETVMKHSLIWFVGGLILTGCSTFDTPRYSVSADTVTALRMLNGKTINVGMFTSSKPEEMTEIACRAAGPVKPPDGQTFHGFIRKALIDELKMANVFSESAPVTLTGNLNNIDFSSTSGTWVLSLTVTSSNGQSATVDETYSFDPSYAAVTACAQTAQAFVPAVQDLIGKLVGGRDFQRLVN